MMTMNDSYKMVEALLQKILPSLQKMQGDKRHSLLESMATEMIEND
jgi:hypothetical protein